MLQRRRDVWAVPPGGPVDGGKSSQVRAWIAYFVVVSLALGGGITYASMRTSTAVSAEDALAEFQAARDTAAESPDELSPEDNRTRRKPARRDTDGPQQARSGPRLPRQIAAGSATASTEATRDARPSTDQGSDRQAPSLPAEGVYAWDIDGYEQAPGVRRDLPKRSHRVITHQGDASWEEHLIFSEEREQWLHLAIEKAGVTTTKVRNRVVMGPVEQDKTVIYNPPVFVARFPSEVGKTWSGSWTGRTSGSYTAKTFEHTTLTIEGKKVEVFGTEVVMEMRGEIEGDAVTRSWYAPRYNLVVKQGQEMQIRTGPGEYRSEWIGQVVSLQPQT